MLQRGTQRCTTQFFTSQFIPPFLQRHRCDALPCFSASPVNFFYIVHIAFPPLLPFFLSPQWFTVQNNKKFTKSHNAAMSPLATRDGHRKRKRNAAMRCTKLDTNFMQIVIVKNTAVYRNLRNDNKISRQQNLHFQNLIVMAFSHKKKKKTAFLNDFPLCPQGHHPKCKFLFLFSSRRL